MAMVPSFSVPDIGVVKDQLLELSAVVDPREEPSAKSSTELLTSAVPVKVGVVLLVRLSEEELPVSESAVRSGVEGAAGGISSRSLIERETDCSEELPTLSVAMTVNE